MNLTTKYDIGDVVWYLAVREQRETIPCSFCNGEGDVALVRGDRLTCPECYGHKTEYGDTIIRAGTIETRTIGLARAEQQLGDLPKVEYMAHESGIGSGSILREDALFPTRNDAEAAAFARGVSLVTEPVR